MNIPQIEEELNTIETLYKTHHITLAVQLLKNLDKKIKNIKMQNEILFRMNSPEIKSIRIFGQDITSLLNLMNCKLNWTVSKKIGNTVVSHYKDNDTGHIYFNVTGTIQTPLLYVLAALMEVELFPEWIPGVYQSEVIKKISEREQLVRYLMDFKILKRETLLKAFGDSLDDGSVFLHTKSIKKNYDFSDLDLDLPEPILTRTEIEGGFILKEIAKSTDDSKHAESDNTNTDRVLGQPIPREASVAIQCVFRFDPKVSFLPTWLLNFIMTSTIGNIVPRLGSHAELFRPGKVHHSLLEFHSSEYKELIQRGLLIFDEEDVK